METRRGGSGRRSAGARQLKGSHRRLVEGSRRIGEVPEDEPVEVTVIVRPRAPLPPVDELGRQPLRERRYLTRRGYSAAFGADPDDLQAVAAFGEANGLQGVALSVPRRTVEFRGPASAMSRAFGTKLARYRTADGDYRGRTGWLHVPPELEPVIQGVFGLDTRRHGRPNFRPLPRERLGESKDKSFVPPRFGELYGFPAHLDGTGQKIAVIELGGGFRRPMLNGYFKALGVEPPRISVVSVDGAYNNPRDDKNDGEVVLDIEIVGSLAPGAEMIVYFAPATERGIVDVMTRAIFDPRAPSVISMSWGEAEGSFQGQTRTALEEAFKAAALLGVTICTAAGDFGYTDGIKGTVAHVDYPASSPHVLACGGTNLQVNDGAVAEIVWNDKNGQATGGGVSEFYDVPAWQEKIRIPESKNSSHRPGRGVPDVAANADPLTGYLVGPAEDARPVGGTSAGAPLWAALIARLNQATGVPAGFINPLLYESIDPTVVFNNVTKGSNGWYRARHGWDACTGLGTPRGAELVAALAGTS